MGWKAAVEATLIIDPRLAVIMPGSSNPHRCTTASQLTSTWEV